MKPQLSDRILEVLATGGEMSRMEMTELCGLPYDSLRKPLGKLMDDGQIRGRKRAVKNISQPVWFYRLPGEPPRPREQGPRIELAPPQEPDFSRILRTLGQTTRQETQHATTRSQNR